MVAALALATGAAVASGGCGGGTLAPFPFNGTLKRLHFQNM